MAIFKTAMSRGAGGDSGGTPTPPLGTLADNEMLKSNVGGTEIVGTGDTNTDLEVDFGSKNIKTTGIITSGTGTFVLGEAIADSSAGENKTTTNLVSGKRFNPVWIDQDENVPTARATVGAKQSLTQEVSKSDVLVNPAWQSDPLVDWRVVELTFESSVTITNVILSITKNGAAFYSALLGTLSADVEKTIDLTDPGIPENVPAEAFAGDVYVLSVSSVDGDVNLKGSTANAIPFFKVGYLPFVDNVVPTYATEDISSAEWVLNEDNMISDSPTAVPTQKSVKKYVDDAVVAQLQYKGGYNADTNAPNLEAPPTGVLTGFLYTVEVSGNFFTVPVSVGDALIAEVDDPQAEADWTILNRNLDAATIKTLYESNANTNAYEDLEKSKLASTPTLQQINDTNGYEISTDGSTENVGFFTANDGVQTQIMNDGLGGNFKNLPSTVSQFVTNPSGNALLDQADGVYGIALRFFAEPSVRDKAFLIEFIAQNGGSPIKIFSRDLRFNKQIKIEEISISFTTPAVATIVNLPISVYITTEDTDAKIWGQSLSVTKSNAPIV